MYRIGSNPPAEVEKDSALLVSAAFWKAAAQLNTQILRMTGKSEDKIKDALTKAATATGSLYANMIGNPDFTRTIKVRGGANTNALKEGEITSPSVSFAGGRDWTFTKSTTIPFSTLQATIKLTASDLDGPIVKSTDPTSLDTGFRAKAEVTLKWELNFSGWYGESIEVGPGEAEETAPTDIDVYLNEVEDAKP